MRSPFFGVHPPFLWVGGSIAPGLTREDPDAVDEQRIVTLGMSGLGNLLVGGLLQRELDESGVTPIAISSRNSKADWSRARAMKDRDIKIRPEHPEFNLKHVGCAIVRKG